MNYISHRIRIKEPTQKLPKHLDKESFLNAVNRGDIPIKIPNPSNAPDEYLRNFNGIAKYCSFRSNQSYKSPDLFTWTLKQQQFHTMDIPKVFLNKSKKSHSTPKRIPTQILETKLSKAEERLKLMKEMSNKNMAVLNPPKRLQVYNAHMYSEKEIKKMEKEEQDYEEKIKGLIELKWGDIAKNANSLRHRKIFSITKMQNDALYEDKNSTFMDTMIDSTGMSNYSQRNHFLNPFEKKNFGINKIIHYIQKKDEDEDVQSVMQTTMKSQKRKKSLQKPGEINEKKLDEIHHEFTGSGIRTSKGKFKRSNTYMQEFETKLETATKIKKSEITVEKNNLVKNLKTSQSQKTLPNEDNILNYNSYFSKRYFNTGFRLELSEKGKNTVRNFEDKLRKSIENFENLKVDDLFLQKIDENENSSLSFNQI